MKRGHAERRRSSGRRERRVVLIVCEGTKTEPLYFGGFRAAARGRYMIKIATSNAKDAVGIAKYAKEQKKRQGLSGKDGDSIWIVFDTDSNSREQLDAAEKLAEADSHKLAMSNPCFELWYLLHFEDRTAALSKEELDIRLRRHIPDYKKNQDYFALLALRRSSALRRAEELESPSARPLSRAANPSTGVGRLVRELAELDALHAEENPNRRLDKRGWRCQKEKRDE